MTDARCPRLWEVEAVRDGRLLGRAATAAEAHIAGCRACSEERTRADALAKELQSLQPRVNELALRRIRQNTLAAADRALREPSPGAAPRKRARWLLCVAAALLLAVGVARPWRHQPNRLAGIQAAIGTSWKRSLVDGVDRVDLSEGTLHIRVRRAAGDPHVVLRVPDGEIEDVGTAFSVWVQGGRTREIAVTEGRIIFRRFGADAVTVASGQVWRSTDEVARAPLPAPAAELRASEPAPNHQAVAKPNASSAQHAQKGAAPTAGAGDHTANATDANTAEDLAYLHIAALLREQRNPEARAAAQEYLRKFPNGFRRVEVLRVVSSPP